MRMLSHNRFCMFEKQAKYCTKMEEEKMGIVVFVLFFYTHLFYSDFSREVLIISWQDDLRNNNDRKIQETTNQVESGLVSEWV